jgi:hypothetical protein
MCNSLESPFLMLNFLSVFYILDSLRTSPTAHREANVLQSILLKHFEEEIFKADRICVHVPQVICLVFLPFFHSLNSSGAFPTKLQGLWLLSYSFCENIFEEPKFNHSKVFEPFLPRYQLISNSSFRFRFQKIK